MSTHLVPGIVLSVLHVSPLLILITVWNVNTIVILILRLVKVRYCKVTWVEHNLNPISLSWDSVLFNSTVQLPEEPQLPILDWWQCFLSVSPLNTSGALLFIQLLRFSQWCFCNFWCIIKGRRQCWTLGPLLALLHFYWNFFLVHLFLWVREWFSMLVLL